jgi:hypothetical protein
VTPPLFLLQILWPDQTSRSLDEAAVRVFGEREDGVAGEALLYPLNSRKLAFIGSCKRGSRAALLLYRRRRVDGRRHSVSNTASAPVFRTFHPPPRMSLIDAQNIN